MFIVKNTVKLLNKIIEEVNLTDEEIDEILMENNENNKVFTEKIIKTIEKYKDDTTSTIARIIGKHCNRESLNNVKKRREIRRKITLNLLEKEEIAKATKRISNDIAYNIISNIAKKPVEAMGTAISIFETVSKLIN